MTDDDQNLRAINFELAALPLSALQQNACTAFITDRIFHDLEGAKKAALAQRPCFNTNTVLDLTGAVPVLNFVDVGPFLMSVDGRARFVLIASRSSIEAGFCIAHDSDGLPMRKGNTLSLERFQLSINRYGVTSEPELADIAPGYRQ